MKTVVFVIAFLLMATFLFAQDSNRVAGAMEALRRAMIEGDRNGLEQYTAKQLSYGHSNGLVESRDKFIESIMSGSSDYLSISFANQTIEVTGKTAVMRHQMAAEIRTTEKTVNLKLGVLLVWVKERGQWKLLARQGFKV